MKLFGIGIGQAGCNIVDTIVKAMRVTGRQFMTEYLAANTSDKDLAQLNYVPEENKYLMWETYLGGEGAGRDNRDGLKAMEYEIDNGNIISLIDEKLHESDAFLLIAGLGGGTGSGGAPLLARELREFRKPVYGLGILPHREEEMIFAYNAMTCLKSFERKVDNLILFDNDYWGIRETKDETMAEAIKEKNYQLAKRILYLFGPGEISEEERKKGMVRSVKPSDAQDIIKTLDCGGISSIGYRSEKVRGSFFPISREMKKAKLLTDLTLQTRKSLTVPCKVEKAKKAYLMFNGNPKYLSEKGKRASIKAIQDLIEGPDVKSADYQDKRMDWVSVTTLFSGLEVMDIPKLKNLVKVAREYKAKKQKLKMEEEKRRKEKEEFLKDIESLL
jgi:cell division GTPase FtsZ